VLRSLLSLAGGYRPLKNLSFSFIMKDEGGGKIASQSFYFSSLLRVTSYQVACNNLTTMI